MKPLALYQSTLQQLPENTNASIRECIPLAGDASGRKYFRLLLDNSPYSSLIVMDYSAGFTNTLTTGESPHEYPFVSVSHYLKRQGVPISQLILNVPEEHFLFVEDVGDITLWQFVFHQLSDEGLMLAQSLGKNATEILFTRALDTLHLLQQCKREEECLAFSRSLGYEQYLTEALRFISLYLEPKGASPEVINATTTFLKELCKAVSSHPHTTSHRDYMAWNIHVLPSGEVRLIDFQDLLQASYMYDLVSLLHDRDIDEALGDDLIRSLFQYFVRNYTESRGTLEQHYTEALLQRHFRLAGQFLSLTEKTGNPQYAAWVPGSLNRLGRFLANYAPAKDITPLLASAVPEIREGMRRSFSFIR